MRVTPRPRRYASPALLRLGVPLLTYDLERRAYRLRVVGDRIGPVLLPNRRCASTAYAGEDRRGDTGRGGRGARARRRNRGRDAVIGGTALLLAVLGIAVALLAHGVPRARSAAAGAEASSRSAHRQSSTVIASGTQAASLRRLSAPAHRAAGARHPAATRRRARAIHRHDVATRHRPVHRRAIRARTPGRTAPAPTTPAAPTAPSTVAPAETTPAPTVSTPPTTSSGRAPVDTTPAPVETPPSSTAPGTGSHGGVTASGGSGGSGGATKPTSSGGSGTVSGGGTKSTSSGGSGTVSGGG